MKTIQELLWSNNDTPMDVAEKAAIRKLNEMDTKKQTEFYKDDFSFTKNYHSTLIQVKGK